MDDTESGSRSIELHAKFEKAPRLDGELPVLMLLWNEVNEHSLATVERDRLRKEEEWQELAGAVEKLRPYIHAVLTDGIDAAKKMPDPIKLVPGQELRTRALEWIIESLGTPQKDRDRRREELQKQSAELAAESAHLERETVIREALTALVESSIDEGDASASKALVETATFATMLLTFAVTSRQDLFKPLAAMRSLWPVMGTDKASWEIRAKETLNDLGLGSGLIMTESQLRELRGSDEGRPARQWARQAIRTIDETRWNVTFFNYIMDKLGGVDAWVDYSIDRGWEMAKEPEWTMPAANLPPLSRNSLEHWKPVVRDLIREQVPDFHLKPEWSTQRSTCEANGRGTPGQIQNAILDDIVSAVKSLAPDESC